MIRGEKIPTLIMMNKGTKRLYALAKFTNAPGLKVMVPTTSIDVRDTNKI